jgi:predicted nucleotidyltransferase
MTSVNSDIAALQAFFEGEDDVDLVILFGSMATGKFSAKSDVDIAIKKSKSLTEDQKIIYIEKIAQITGRAVDLVDLSTVGEPLLGQIIKYGKRLMGTDANYAELGLQHIYAQADFVPYITRTLKERRQQWINS